MKTQEPTIDGFYAKMLENFGNQFEDGVKYPGAYVKQQIHGLILRIR
jgi:hypothetical protein